AYLLASCRDLNAAVSPAVHVGPLAGNVARVARAEKRSQVGHVAGIAEVAEWNLAGELLLALACGVQALVDLLAVDPPGGEAVHGDAVTAHVAGKRFRPRVDGGLGRARRVGAARLRRAGDIDY